MAALRALPAAERLAVLDRLEASAPDPACAPPAAIDRVAGFIGPEGRLALRAEAAREAAEARQGQAAEVAAATGPEIDSIRRTGQETPGFAEKARAVLSTVDMDALGRRTRIAKATHAAGQNMRFMTPEDMTGVADTYRPASDAAALSGPEGPAVDAAAEAAETYAAVRAEAEAIKARRAADPAGYAMQHRAVRAAFDEAFGDGGLAGALSGGGGAKLRRAMSMRLSLQEAMGIAPADRRVLANDERRQTIALLAQATREQKPVLLRQLRQALGARAEDAIAEMVDDGLDAGVELIARISDHPALAAEAAKAMATPYAELIRGIEPEDVKALDARLNEHLAPWRDAIGRQENGRQRAAQQSAVVRAVAFARLGQTRDPEGAADSAVNDLIHASTTVVVNGLLVPKSLDGQAIDPNHIANALQYTTMRQEVVADGQPTEALGGYGPRESGMGEGPNPQLAQSEAADNQPSNAAQTAGRGQDTKGLGDPAALEMQRPYTNNKFETLLKGVDFGRSDSTIMDLITLEEPHIDPKALQNLIFERYFDQGGQYLLEGGKPAKDNGRYLFHEQRLLSAEESERGIELFSSTDDSFMLLRTWGRFERLYGDYSKFLVMQMVADGLDARFALMSENADDPEAVKTLIEATSVPLEHLRKSVDEKGASAVMKIAADLSQGFISALGFQYGARLTVRVTRQITEAIQAYALKLYAETGDIVRSANTASATLAGRQTPDVFEQPQHISPAVPF